MCDLTGPNTCVSSTPSTAGGAPETIAALPIPLTNDGVVLESATNASPLDPWGRPTVQGDEVLVSVLTNDATELAPNVLAAEYRPTMDAEALHSWAKDAVRSLNAQSSTIENLTTTRTEDLSYQVRLENVIAAVQEALSRHPVCTKHPEGDPVSCGWKSAVADITEAVAEATINANEAPM